MERRKKNGFQNDKIGILKKVMFISLFFFKNGHCMSLMFKNNVTFGGVKKNCERTVDAKELWTIVVISNCWVIG